MDEIVLISNDYFEFLAKHIYHEIFMNMIGSSEGWNEISIGCTCGESLIAIISNNLYEDVQ